MHYLDVAMSDWPEMMAFKVGLMHGMKVGLMHAPCNDWIFSFEDVIHKESRLCTTAYRQTEIRDRLVVTTPKPAKTPASE